MRCFLQSSEKILVLTHHFGFCFFVGVFLSSVPPISLYQTQNFFSPFLQKSPQNKSSLWLSPLVSNRTEGSHPYSDNGTVFLALLFSFPASPFTFFLPCCVSQRCCLVSIPQRHLTDSFSIPPQSSSLQ